MKTHWPACHIQKSAICYWRLAVGAIVLLFLATCLLCAPVTTVGADLGIFEAQGEVGKPGKPGSVVFDQKAHSYMLAGGGENMWFTNDAFHFVWKRVSGDFALQAAVEFLGSGGNAHRKACLMARQSLAPDSAYVDVAVHGDGLTSLQFRETPGGTTHEIQANVSRPARVGLEREGEVFFMTLPDGDKPSAKLSPGGAFVRLTFTDPLYIGLAVCAHDDRVLERARFSDAELQQKAALAGKEPVLHCTLETVPIASKDRRAIYHTLDHIEAPNWSRDGNHFLFNSGGRIYRLPVTGGKPELVDTGFAIKCNNDHGFSPDGMRLAISDQSKNGKSLIYVLPASGGTPRPITRLGPSYWHGWSPDAATLAYCAERNGEFDIYTIPATGGEEKRLTSAKGLDDGPDYSPDGKFIYFNSDRIGTMQIWRMKADGSDQQQVTFDEFNNWFPHPSPDGKWLVFLSYDQEVTGHPANKPVRLRLMPVGGGPTQDLARLFGGQGTMNVPSWSPDSRQVAFVSYELIRAE
ncbi:MAG: TolB family protein [Limisphaerales bacterium]